MRHDLTNALVRARWSAATAAPADPAPPPHSSHSRSPPPRAQAHLRERRELQQRGGGGAGAPGAGRVVGLPQPRRVRCGSRRRLVGQQIGRDGAAQLGPAELRGPGQGKQGCGGAGGRPSQACCRQAHRTRVTKTAGAAAQGHTGVLQRCLGLQQQPAPTSQVSMSGPVLVQPRRAHSTAPMAAGLPNQVPLLKVARRRNRSPRSQGRPLAAPVAGAAATGRLGSSCCACRCGR